MKNSGGAFRCEAPIQESDVGSIYTVIHNYGNPWFLLCSFWRNRLRV